ncbi:nucleotide exchange factor GrpE [Desulfobotulus mexicanus]|uniref:Protein GrpE n=1 Tax=Desulfobotulus mexicanus TaxID=2586642 RepID=A0A5S5ME25_9BACT|nr:nucleotide exchange factor GrpE [Desulfobotulus mexicanus]TYT73986.1 nucleotide exchange factor GrpE [Desulfobotulus mexicanus]
MKKLLLSLFQLIRRLFIWIYGQGKIFAIWSYGRMKIFTLWIWDQLKIFATWLYGRMKNLILWMDRKCYLPFLKWLAHLLNQKVQEKSEKDTPLTDWKKSSLEDFETWLKDLPDTPPSEGAGMESCDLYTLLSEFSGLRQEIRMQNREQVRAIKTLQQFMDDHNDAAELFRSRTASLVELEVRIRDAAEQNAIRPFLDVRDALLRGLEAAKAPQRKGFRFFRSSSSNAISAMQEGYTLTLQRLDAAFATAGIRAIETDGKDFDPRWMKAIHVEASENIPSGKVIRTLSSAYIRKDAVLRYADVIVSE